MNDKLNEIFENSELVYQVKNYFDEESAKKMIEELKTEIRNNVIVANGVKASD